MHLGVCTLTFRLASNDSLKGKRRIVRSLSERLQQRFNLAIAEVGEQDSWKILVLGIVCVSNKANHTSEMLDAALSYMERLHLEMELINVQREVLSGV